MLDLYDDEADLSSVGNVRGIFNTTKTPSR